MRTLITAQVKRFPEVDGWGLGCASRFRVGARAYLEVRYQGPGSLLGPESTRGKSTREKSTVARRAGQP